MQRVVLTSEVTRDDIDDAAMRCGWQLTNVLPGSAQQPAQMIYAALRGSLVLYLVEDGRLDVLYFAAAGDGAREALAQVRRELACCDENAHHQYLAGADDVAHLRRGLGILVLQSKTASDEAVALFERVLSHADLQIRSLGLVAATYAPWPQLRTAIERVAQHDPLPQLRANASQLIAVLFTNESM